MIELENRVNRLENRVEGIEKHIDAMEQKQDKMFDKLLSEMGGIKKSITTANAKLGKAWKWVLRLLGVIIVLLLVIAIKSPSTAVDIVKTTGGVITAIK